MRILKWFFLLFICLWVGCGPENGGKKKSSKNVRFDPANFNTYKPSDVLIQIGDQKLTRRDVDRLVDLRMRTLRMSMPPAQRGMKLNRMAVQAPLLANAAGAFRAQTAMLQWAATNGVTVGKEDIALFEQKFMDSCHVKGLKFKMFLNQFPAQERGTIKERIRVEAISAKVRDRFIADHKNEIKPASASAFISYLTNYNHTAMATNALVWAKATNLWLRAKNGADFPALAEENTEDASHPQNGEWGAFRMGDLGGDGDLDKVVSAMKVGDVSAPVEADNGLNILKLDAITDMRDNPIPESARSAETRYHLSRIFLRLPEIYDIPKEEEAAATLKLKAEDDLFLKFVQGLMAVDGVKYPHGEAVFETARQIMRMPMMLQQEGMGKEGE